MKRYLDEEQKEIEKIRLKLEAMDLKMRVDFLREKTLNSSAIGVSDEKLCDSEVVVSLTSFGKRIFDTYLAVESIMQGTVKPNRIVLWLSREEFEGKTLPRTLELQKERGLEVKYCEDVKSFKKLIPSLRDFPEACIITVDDDAMYEYDLVERLVAAHRECPRAICACRVHKVKLGDNQKPVGYLDWDWCVEEYCVNSNLLFPTGVGGILYPPHSFPQQILDCNTFLSICPHADDVWFYAMRLLNDIPVVQVYTGNPLGYFTELPSRNIGALSSKNTDPVECGNDVQLKAVFEKYNLYEKLL
jgi:hypothetical protein